MVEWCILTVVVLCFVVVFGLYAQRIHSQAERASVLSTLGAVRSALVLRQLQLEVAGAQRAAPAAGSEPANPFDALAQYPATYAGTVSGRDVGAVPAGTWVFDAACACIGYKPLYRNGLESNEQLEALWFQRRGSGHAIFLLPLDRYVWYGQLIE